MMAKNRGDKLRKGKFLRNLDKSPKPTEAAEIIGIQGLSFLASEPAQLAAFLEQTGIGPQTLRQAAKEPHFLGMVISFIRADEARARDFCAAHGLDSKALDAVQELLAGPGWEREVP